MILFTFDHSFEDDYFYLSSIDVKENDVERKSILERKIEELDLIGMLEYPGNDLKKRLAEIIGVDEAQIDFDTEEIDIM